MSDLYSRQRKLNINKDQVIYVVGCGGVGFNVAMLLTMAGVKNTVLFDGDSIEESNLNRLPVPYEAIGMNKAEVCYRIIKQMRTDLEISFYKKHFNEDLIASETAPDWIIDCTDDFTAQVKIFEFAKSIGCKYCKPGYEGERISINDEVAQWNINPEDNEGYVETPSWAVPSMIVASLTVAKVLKYTDKEMGCEIKNLFLK